MNKINTKKLLNSKWTATKPQNKEKHFVVIDVEFDDEKNIVRCVIQALMTKRENEINWRDLKDRSVWRLGWL